MSVAMQLAEASQQQHRRYRELFGTAPVGGAGWRDLAMHIRTVGGQIEDLRATVVATGFSTTVLPTYTAATRGDVDPFDGAADASDVFGTITDSSAGVNVNGADAIASNAAAEAAEIAAVPNPDSPDGLAAIVGIITHHQARSAAIVSQAAQTEQQLGQQAANAGGPGAEDDDHIQLVDHTFAEAPPLPSPLPEPDAGSGGGPPLGLPRYDGGTLSPAEVRTVYAHGELRMRELNERLIAEGLSPEQRAKIMFDQRNALRTWTRELMADRELAEQITAQNPNLTWEDLIARNQAKGLQGDDLWNAIIDSSTRSRPSVNDALGVDPEHPPPLPAAPTQLSPSGGIVDAPLGTNPAQPPGATPSETTTDGAGGAGGGSGGGGSWGAEDSRGADESWGTSLSALPREELEDLARNGDPAMRVIAQLILQSPEYQARNPPPMA